MRGTASNAINSVNRLLGKRKRKWGVGGWGGGGGRTCTNNSLTNGALHALSSVTSTHARTHAHTHTHKLLQRRTTIGRFGESSSKAETNLAAVCVTLRQSEKVLKQTISEAVKL